MPLAEILKSIAEFPYKELKFTVSNIILTLWQPIEDATKASPV